MATMNPRFTSLAEGNRPSPSLIPVPFITPQTQEILKQVGSGKCTLFFGAGASLSAQAPTGDSLSNSIISDLLSLTTAWPMSVDHAFSLALANRNRIDVENFLRGQLQGLTPSASHRMLTWFRWRALITTNYDTLIERAYKTKIVTQRLNPIINESELPRVGYSPEEYVPLLKPHGCISSPKDMSLGLEGVHAAKKDRRLMFSYIEMLHLAGPVIYIGYSMRDTHIIDMICELKERLSDRTEILFVTKQEPGRNEIEQAWFQKLGVQYLDWGFEGLMEYLSRNLTPAIAPSKIVPDLNTCHIVKFGDISYQFQRPFPGVWECWFDYRVNHPDDFVCLIFQTKNEPLDISQYDSLSFELNVPTTARQGESIEAVKLEGYNRIHQHPINLTRLKRDDWQPVRIGLDKFKPRGVKATAVRQVVFTDTGQFAVRGQRYKVGIRNIRFEKSSQGAEPSSHTRRDL